MPLLLEIVKKLPSLWPLILWFLIFASKEAIDDGSIQKTLLNCYSYKSFWYAFLVSSSMPFFKSIWNTKLLVKLRAPLRDAVNRWIDRLTQKIFVEIIDEQKLFDYLTDRKFSPIARCSEVDYSTGKKPNRPTRYIELQSSGSISSSGSRRGYCKRRFCRYGPHEEQPTQFENIRKLPNGIKEIRMGINLMGDRTFWGHLYSWSIIVILIRVDENIQRIPQRGNLVIDPGGWFPSIRTWYLKVDLNENARQRMQNIVHANVRWKDNLKPNYETKAPAWTIHEFELVPR